MSVLRWFSKAGVAQLAQLQKSAGEITPLVCTMIAAYKQFDDITLLMQLLDSDIEHFDPEQRAIFDKIHERHEKYRAAQEGET